MSGFRTAAAIGVLVGAIGVATAPLPTVRLLEDTFVLSALFHLRGPVAPPRDVVVVTMDERSAAMLGFAMPQREWPRRAHATLVSRLVEQGAAAIAFDVEFFRASPDKNDDALFAAAVRGARRVVFVERVEALKVGASQIWERQQPIAILKEAAVATAPAPLPDMPVVSWTWLYLPTPQGDTPSLAVAALQTAAAMRSESRPRWTRALASLSGASPTAYLNLYGPPGSVCSVPYAEVINESGPPRCSLDGAIVFVGAGDSGVARAGQPDTYHAAYSGDNGVDFSGVELHATALANLLDGSSLHVLPASFILIFMWCAGLGAAGYAVRSGRARGRVTSSRKATALCFLLAATAYGGVAYACFVYLHALVPIGVPIAVQTPTALIVVLILRARETNDQVPVVCLATDASGSTELGQRMRHDAYARLMHDYIVRLSAPVLARSGEVLDPQGDGFVSIWRCSGSTKSTRLEACRAALDLLDAADSFGHDAPEGMLLPTRVALTMGAVTLHSDADRGTFEAYGDVVNLAARLRDLNTQLGTRLIASADVVEGLEDALFLRPLIHDHVMKGIAHPPPIVEVMRAAPMRVDHAGGV